MVQFSEFTFNREPFRQGQLGAFDVTTKRVMQDRERHTAIVLPTRYGKTDFMLLTGLYLMRHEAVSGMLIMTPNRVLRNQATDDDKLLSSLRRYEVAVKRLMPDGKERAGIDPYNVNETPRPERLIPNPPMGGVRTGEGGEGVTGAMIRARIRVDGRLAGGLEALLGAPMAAYSGCGERDGGIGHGKRRSRTGLARVCGDVGLAGGSVADGRRQAGSGMARSRARARLNCSSQGQRRGRCRVNRRAERVSRPAKAKTRRLRVLVVTIC